MFTSLSQAIIYGRHLDVAERMLDFDFLAGREPSVAGIVDPNAKQSGSAKVFFGHREILIPIYSNIASIPENPHIDTFLNFASFRSAASATHEALESRKFRNIVIIAEGIPERDIRDIIALNAREYHTRIIGPATAGAIGGGTLRLGNNGGSLENIVESRLYEQGSVGFISRSGGMSNEMYRVISKRTDGIHTGIALGGDRFVGSTFRDITLAYENTSEIRMIVLLGEVGSRDELEVAELIQSGKITKPVVAYVSGSFAEHLTGEVQFGHAGAKANASEETASYKNTALRNSGAHVPMSYADFWSLIETVFRTLPEIQKPRQSEADIAKKMTQIRTRKPTKFTSTIADERWEDVLYNHIPLTNYIHDGSLAKVLGALWLKRELPETTADFINTILILLADHGPAVSGATNTIVTARAGKDILSSLISGLLTIGPRFGGAIDGAARYFYEAVQNQETPEDFIDRMKRAGTPIPGIGHKVKSKFHPDGRCTLLREKVIHYNLPQADPTTKYGRFLTYALAVEALTLEKKPNLILNVDGHIAVILLDLFESMGMDHAEIRMYIDAGLFNAFFILARSIGFIGHALDQKRLGEPLYRTSWEDICYSE